MKIMMLGGGTNQLSAIRRIITNGDVAVVSDYLESSPGKEMTEHTVQADTFSYEETLKAAVEEGVEAILTVGTDQPVLTAACVAKTLGLPSAISPQTARAVTNKKLMKAIFEKFEIPSVSYAILGEEADVSQFGNVSYPAVLKPVDSQGQRGIFKVGSPEEVMKKLPESLRHSRTKEAVLETYYRNQEVTVSGWVDKGKVHILTMTDRVTFQQDERIGVCVSHEHPSKHIGEYGNTARRLTEDIVKAFEIHSGPIYFQFLIGEDGMLANEIACRIGGAYEDQFIPEITGFDILQAHLDIVTGKPVSVADLEGFDFTRNDACVSVQLFFAEPGKVASVSGYDDMVNVEGVADFRCHYQVGDEIPEISNASARAGFGLIYGENEEALRRNIGLFYDRLEIRDVNDRNLVIRGCRGYR